MKHKTLKTALLAASVMSTVWLTALPARALVVFDPWNYGQNIMTAARSLEEVNNQIQQLTHEVEMISRMDLNLKELGSTVAPELQASMGQIKDLLKQADGIALSVSETDAAMQKLFPADYAKAMSIDDSLKAAKTRWDETLSSFKRSMSLEAKVVENTSADGDSLADLLNKSGNAVGNLEVQQAGNELTGLQVKQELQLQNLMAADQRSQSLDHARMLAAEQEGHLRFQNFVGSGAAYTP